ncbi:ribonuclease H-like domain-containing protein, partial [Tanacetum coccineum]
SPLTSHLKIAFKILRYLKSCPGLGVHITKTSDMFLNAYSDADWAKCVVTRKSVTGNSAIKIAANLVFNERTKHLEIDLHFVREKVLKGIVKTVKVDSANQIADILTKGLDTVQHLELVKKLGMYDVNQPMFYTDSVKGMDKLELLQINFVCLHPWKNDFARNLRWLCLHGFDGIEVFKPLDMRNMVALDMSYSRLRYFTLPQQILPSLKILNLKSSLFLSEINNLSALPNLETLILWNCHKLVHVCESLGDLRNLALLNMTGCESLQRTFSLPHSLECTFFKDCYLECTDDFPLGFSDQLSLQYLNLGNSLFKQLPSYNH